MNKNIFILAGLAIAVAFTGCTKDFEDINTNPNEPASVSPGFLLTSAQKRIMDEMNDSFWGSRRGMQLAQHWSSNQYSNESRYQFRTETSNGSWRDFYAAPLQDLQQIINLNTDDAEAMAGYGSNGNQIAVAQLLQAWVYQMLTDAWGPIPMTEALQGVDNTSPTFDSQEAVYNGILGLINGALASMDGGAGPQGDQVYGGDMASWTMFANSLKLRVAMRMSDVSPTAAQAAGESALDGGMIIAANESNAQFPYIDAAPNNHPVNEDYKTRNDFAASNTMVDWLSAMNDPRLGVYFNPAVATDTYVGEVYGLDEANAALTPNDAVSQRGDAVLAGNLPGIYFDAAQTHFLCAEAAERGWSGTPLDAEGHYNAAITLSMQWWGLTDADAINAYLAQADVAYTTAAGDWKQRIGSQKWAALYMQGHEAWAEVRRLDAPALNACADGHLAGDGSVPSRFEYPLDEQTLNSSGYGSGVAALGGDDALETKLWWDVN
ncbi:SusD/RagB family nutrient-binding outer membrane lipoprotein [Flavobacteriales bacterium]|nr:SusD/RagB family nutrient-binding outer membrane lipoprotein [Flavobacteriales bacterium]